MCSRFEIKASPRKIARRFGLGEDPVLPASREIRPTGPALVIAAGHSGGPRPLTLSWGLASSWDGKPLINARAETLAKKKSFRPFIESRCLVPATGYFEWRRMGGGKLKNRIYVSGVEVFAFAGLMDATRFTILTCAPHGDIAHIHNRMPVILSPGNEAGWLDPGTSFRQVRRFLIPYGAHPRAAREERPNQPDLFP